MSGISTRSRWFLGMAMGGALALSANCALGQVKPIPDNTLGSENSVVTPSVIKDVPSDQIDGGAIRGRNLFHSFQEFNIDSRRGAYFTNPAGIENIFSRVTGGNASKIFGTLGVLGNANLFLINPNGIIFGRFSSLDVRGSFVGTTANAIQFGNQGFFSATNPEALSPLLTINPSALLFNQIVRSASIQNSSTAPAGVAPTGLNASGLRVPDGKSLLLVGGDITIDNGRLRAYGGLVELGGLAATGTVGLGVNGNNISLSFPTDSTRASVSLINGANVTVSADGGGSITVNASNLNITGGSSLIAGIGQGLGSVGAKAGDITLNATGDIKIDGSGITNNVQQQGIGNGGNITLSTNSLSLTNGAQLQAVTLGQGDAGNVIINATNSVSLDGRRSDIFSTVGSAYDSPENAIKGNGGNIQITTPQLSLTNGAQLQASTFGQGDAGNVIINATNSVSLDGSYTNINGQFLPSGIFSSVGNVYDRPEQRNATKGNGGNIQITTPQLSLTNGAQLQAGTLAQGNSGSVIINATKSVSLDHGVIFSSVGNVYDRPEQRNATKGNGGNIQITTPQISLTNGAELIASTVGQGDAGNVIINATKSVSLDGSYTNINGEFLPSGIFSSVGNVYDRPEQSNATKGNGGNIQITTPQISLTNGAELIASTGGQGDAGNVTVNALDAVSLADAAIFSTVESGGVGKGGNININAATLSLKDGARLEASTLGQGNAGTIKVNAAQDVTISGKSSNLNSGLYVDSQSKTGTAGDIIVTSPRVTLDNSGILNAKSESGNGGNINLQSDLLIMRRGALISTTAGMSQAGGNGGNITINATNGFIVAVPNENSDITANAFNGSGGSVKINATNIFGITPRSREDLVKLLGTNEAAELDSQRLPTSDITAISQTSPTLNGTVTVNNLGIDPTQGLVNLPVIPVDTKVAQGCYAGGTQAKSEFIVTGRGGLPPNPGEPLSTDAVDVGLVTLNHGSDNRKSATHSQKPTPIRTPIVQATGWTRNAKGEVVLTADASNVTPQSPRLNPQSCHGVQNN